MVRTALTDAAGVASLLCTAEVEINYFVHLIFTFVCCSASSPRSLRRLKEEQEECLAAWEAWVGWEEWGGWGA